MSGHSAPDRFLMGLVRATSGGVTTRTADHDHRASDAGQRPHRPRDPLGAELGRFERGPVLEA